MKETYDQAMVRVLADEGGYSDDAGDPGGPTKYGITIHDVRLYLNPHATADDVKHLTVDQAKDIYAKHYAIPVRYDDLPAGVDYAVFDYGINSGVGRSNKILQKLVGVKQDGIIGPQTLEAVRLIDPDKLIKDICTERLGFLKSLGTWHLFSKGWGRRVHGVEQAALAMSKQFNKH